MGNRTPILLTFVCLFVSCSVHAQTSPPVDSRGAPPAQPVPKLDYPDSTSGLKHLAEDILKAQAKNDLARADMLLRSLVLPKAYDWYERVFGSDSADNAGDYYEHAAASIPPFLARTFLNTRQQNFTEIRAVRFENSCDNDASEDAYGFLIRRHEPVPLYELRFMNATQFVRIFPIVYVDDGFRFLLPPDYRPPASDKKANDAAPMKKRVTPEDAPRPPRIRIGGAVQNARLLNRVQPEYPESARRARIQGTVKLHTIIGKDGRISQITSVHGVCVLAESAVAAVRQWRYSPTLMNGDPVEVDTEISVIFALQQ